MKRFFALLLAIVMVFSLVACGAKEEAPATQTPAAQPSAGGDAAGTTEEAGPTGPDAVDLKALDAAEVKVAAGEIIEAISEADGIVTVTKRALAKEMTDELIVTAYGVDANGIVYTGETQTVSVN